MDVIVMLIFVSSILAACSVGAFVATMQSGEAEEADSLSLLPLSDDAKADVRP